VGSRERPETEDIRPIPPSVWVYHLGELGTGRSGCNQPTAETAIEVREGRGPRPTSANLSGLRWRANFPEARFWITTCLPTIREWSNGRSDRPSEAPSAITVWCGIVCLCKEAPWAHRLFIVLPSFVSTASAAENFRSRCGSVREAPVCNSQTSPIAAAQVLQGTDNICFGVSSLVFTTAYCNVPQRKRCSILLTFNTLAKRQLPFWFSQRFFPIMSRSEHLR